MKKFLLLLLAMTVCAFSHADESQLQLIFETSDGEFHAFDANGLKITVNNDELIVSNPTQTVAYPSLKLVKMYFSQHSAATDITADDIQGPVEVFTADGKYIGKFASKKYAVEKLPKGLYVIKSNSKTSKLFVP